MTFIAVYVDDIIIICSDINYLNEIKRKLGLQFTMKDLGEISQYLGITIKRNRNSKTICLTQKKYVDDILKKYGMQDCNPVSISMEPNTYLSKTMLPITIDDKEEMANIPYQSAVGSLNYLMLATRPDIAYAVGAVSRFSSNPGKKHWEAVKCIF
jgi:Reverse transcriptase (RNA-dependent DNA polymerase)